MPDYAQTCFAAAIEVQLLYVPAQADGCMRGQGTEDIDMHAEQLHLQQLRDVALKHLGLSCRCHGDDSHCADDKPFAVSIVIALLRAVW